MKRLAPHLDPNCSEFWACERAHVAQNFRRFQTQRENMPAYTGCYADVRYAIVSDRDTPKRLAKMGDALYFNDNIRDLIELVDAFIRADRREGRKARNYAIMCSGNHAIKYIRLASEVE